MKKLILVVVAIFSIAVMFTSCKDAKKDADKHEMHKHEAGETAHNAYQCPMDCEKGKTYEKDGNCPVCKMDLKENSSEGEMKHADNCSCKDGGECKCEEGKCQCKSEAASVAKECGKCEPGKCVCEGKEVAKKAMECSKCEPGKCECKAEAVIAPKANSGCGSKGSAGCKTSCTSKV